MDDCAYEEGGNYDFCGLLVSVEVMISYGL